MAEQIRAVVITASDACARGERADESGAALVELLGGLGAEIVAAEVLADDLEPLKDKLRTYAERTDVNLILTTGGTGFSPRDNTPEATRAVIERDAPGLAEAMRAETLRQTPTAMISRGVCGIRAGTLIINLPGAPNAVRECFAVIRPVLGHAVTLLAGRSHEEAKRTT
ncbi:MAG TPA: MogA/MoaB family molybdenum cofactor biosynthesis protein [Pyrinomonadaceae bacterium]|nr:MogA/MoaB family molybdenum cofactor biosynthesis protein [Pyrinomonadaceae bacterium]